MKPKPMDPKRLAEIRRTVNPVRHPGFSALLADRDYQETRATSAEDLAKRLAAQLQHQLDMSYDPETDADAERLLDEARRWEKEFGES